MYRLISVRFRRFAIPYLVPALDTVMESSPVATINLTFRHPPNICEHTSSLCIHSTPGKFSINHSGYPPPPCLHNTADHYSRHHCVGKVWRRTMYYGAVPFCSVRQRTLLALRVRWYGGALFAEWDFQRKKSHTGRKESLIIEKLECVLFRFTLHWFTAVTRVIIFSVSLHIGARYRARFRSSHICVTFLFETISVNKLTSCISRRNTEHFQQDMITLQLLNRLSVQAWTLNLSWFANLHIDISFKLHHWRFNFVSSK